MNKLRKQFRRGTTYKIAPGGRAANITFWGSFDGPERTGRDEETFLVFRLEPLRSPRIPGKKSK